MSADGIELVVVSDRRQAAAADRTLLSVVVDAVRAGAPTVLLREKDLPAGERSALAARMRAVTAAGGARLVVAGDADLAARVGADGVHLAAAAPWPGDPDWPFRRPPPDLGVSRSCHRVDELQVARDRGAAWATYSPVFPTRSKPGYGPPLGLDALAAGCRAVPDLPVVALGGVDATTATACRHAGAAGVAVLGAVMASPDPRAATAALVRAVRPDAPAALPPTTAARGPRR